MREAPAQGAWHAAALNQKAELPGRGRRALESLWGGARRPRPSQPAAAALGQQHWPWKALRSEGRRVARLLVEQGAGHLFPSFQVAALHSWRELTGNLGP